MAPRSDAEDRIDQLIQAANVEAKEAERVSKLAEVRAARRSPAKSEGGARPRSRTRPTETAGQRGRGG